MTPYILWWRRRRVSLGLDCVHMMDPKAWRPASLRPDQGNGPFDVPARCCCYCERVEALTPREFYATFGREFFTDEVSA